MVIRFVFSDFIIYYFSCAIEHVSHLLYASEQFNFFIQSFHSQQNVAFPTIKHHRPSISL